MMRLRHIEVFHAVYVSGSISAAARALHVSQPSVSKVLHHAEDQAGFLLFHRLRGRLIPTDEAHALFREVDDVFRRLRSLQQAVDNIRTGGGGHVRLAVVPSLGLSVAPVAISIFRREFPEITFDVQTLHHDDLFQALYERACDIAIAYDPPAHPRLTRSKLADGELRLLYRDEDFDDHGRGIPLTRLNGRDMVGLTLSGPIGDLFSAELQRQEVEVREVVSVQTFYVAAALVRQGAALAVVDEFTAAASSCEGVSSRGFDPPIRFSVECIFLEDRAPSPIARKFLARLKQVLAQAHGPGPACP